MRAHKANARVSNPEGHRQPTFVREEPAKTCLLMTRRHVVNGTTDLFPGIAEDLAMAHLVLANPYKTWQILFNGLTPVFRTGVYPWSWVIIAFLYPNEVNVVARP